MTRLSDTLTRRLTKYGTAATWWKRTRGAKDSVSGHSAETWNTASTTYIFSFPIMSTVRDTPAGEAVEERHEVYSIDEYPTHDRLVWGSETYEVELESQKIFFDNAVAYYRAVVVRMT